MIANNTSERHQNNNLKVIIVFSNILGSRISFHDIIKPKVIMNFLDTKRKSIKQDPDSKWIITWNHYLIRIKNFFRWLYNYRAKNSEEILPQSEWITPPFARIKQRKSKRLSPYSETEIWDLDELLAAVKSFT